MESGAYKTLVKHKFCKIYSCGRPVIPNISFFFYGINETSRFSHFFSQTTIIIGKIASKVGKIDFYMFYRQFLSSNNCENAFKNVLLLYDSKIPPRTVISQFPAVRPLPPPPPPVFHAFFVHLSPSAELRREQFEFYRWGQSSYLWKWKAKKLVILLFWREIISNLTV